MSFDLIIKNGTVILENEARVIDIAVQGGKIAAIGENLGEAKNVLDATGLIVSPGMVDAHTHISEPGRTHWEGYETGTRAAAKGGITTMIEMPLNQLPATVDRETIELKFDAAKGKLTIDAAQLGGLVSYNLDRLHELDEVGVVGFTSALSPPAAIVASIMIFATLMTGSFTKARKNWGKWTRRYWYIAKML